MTFAIHTFGCRVNQADSFDIEESLRGSGAAPASAEVADLVVVNTCTVTGAADRAARNLIRRVAGRNPAARIVVTGCYATRAPRAVASLPHVADVVANDDKPGFFGRRDGPDGAGLEPGAMGRTAYPLRVQTGCDASCAFCVVPSTRGASRSRPVADILEHVDHLGRAGYKELWLVGVHLGSYGRDLPGAPSLLDLLRALDRAPGDVSFRLSSVEPMDCPVALVDFVAGSGRFAPHFHLPLQHASDHVLALMRRPYAFEACRDILEHVRARLPRAAIGTDLIAGFPGESSEDAGECAEAIARLPLSYLHVFPYSDRPGTAAAAMTPKVAPADTKRRADRLREIGAALSARFAGAQVGTVRPGLTLEDGTTVLTDNFLKITIPPGLRRNVRVNIWIETSEPTLAGRIV
jgi:threonylcarbamoyladenosine tRNA methylthiotransferase MtaB